MKVGIRDKAAVCWCADGALALAAEAYQYPEQDDPDVVHYIAASALLREAAFKLTGERSYISVNDGAVRVRDKPLTHDAILSVFDYGIDLAKSREELNMTRFPQC